MTPSRFEELQKFVEQDPTDPFNHYVIALEYGRSEQYPEAIQAFIDLIQFDPTYVPAYHQLALLYIRLTRRQDARAMLERGLQAAALVGDTHARDEMQEAIDTLDE